MYLQRLEEQNGLRTGLLGDPAQLAQSLGQYAQQAQQQAMQAGQQHEAQMQQAAAMAEQAEAQRQAEEAKKRQQIMQIGMMIAGGGLGGGEAAAGGAGSAAADEIGTEMLNDALATANFTPEALGIAVQQATPNIMNGIGWGQPLKRWF